MTIRQAHSHELARLHEINEASVPGVGRESLEELTRLASIAAATLVVERDDEIAGFVLCMVEGAPYLSPNYLWLSERYPRFAYVDRVAVAPGDRGGGIGAALYEAVIARFSADRPVLLAEVNLQPPNPGSLRFHERFGFVAVGERWADDNSKGVVYLSRPLAG